MLDPYAPEAIADPVGLWTRLRRDAPVLEVPGSPGHFLIARYADVRRVCSEPATFSNELLASVQRGPDGRPRLVSAPSKDSPHGRVLGAADGRVHARHRRLLARAFSARRMRQLDQWLVHTARELVAAAPLEMDAVDALAAPLPARTMAHLLGLPADDARRLSGWSDAVMGLMGGLLEAEMRERVDGEILALQAYLDDALRSADPSDPQGGVRSVLRGAIDDGALAPWEAAGLIFQLVVGGSETTVGLIAAAVRRLAERPDEARALRAQPERLGSFIEETLRLDGPAIGNYRRTRVDTRLAGCAIPSGSTLTLLWGSANRDEAVFARADCFDPGRGDLGRHLAFGHGLHFCLGAALARLEARAALGALLARTATIELACDPARLATVPSLFIRRLARLPLRLSAPPVGDRCD